MRRLDKNMYRRRHLPYCKVAFRDWHWIEVPEQNTVMFEVKKGAYEPLGEENVMG